MRKKIRIFAFIAFAYASINLGFGQSTTPPSNLTVEFIREAEKVHIQDSKPEFSWNVPLEAVVQKGYQLIVSSSKEQANNNIGDVWDSGLVKSSKTSDIELGKGTLNPNTTYFWRVRIADKDNKLTPYSLVQQFNTSDFKGDITTQNFFIEEKIKPVKLVKNTDGSYFVDFGKAAFASMEINYKAKKNEVLTIRIGEKLLNGKLDQNPGGTIRYQEIKLKVNPKQQTYQLNIVADERNTNHLAILLPDSFPVLIPFRYAEIVGANQKLKTEDITQRAFFNYFDYTTSAFESTDTILNQVWDICKYSMKATSFAGYYVDGERERIPYEADAYLNQLSHYCTDNEYAIARKTIEYFFVSKPTWPTEWQMHVAMMMYQDYMYTGNTEIIEKYYERLKAKTLMELEVEDGFISTKSPKHNGEFLLKLGFPDSTSFLRDIVDWPPKSKNFGGKGPIPGEQDNYDFKPINTVVNGFYYHNMKIMAEFATLLNKDQEALDFEYRAARVKKSINEKLFDQENGYYIDGIGTDHASLHANMILMAFDLVPESRKKSVMNHIKSKGMVCSVYGAQYLMEALYKGGEENYAYELMTATHDRSWYNMIKIGSTITLEAWDMKYKSNGDWNHAWGAVPANIIPRWTWGIRPKTPGFGVVTINPQPGKLKKSSIVYPTIAGQIKGAYEKINNKQTNYTIELPANMPAEFKVDLSIDDTLILNGETVNSNFKTVHLKPGKNTIVINKL